MNKSNRPVSQPKLSRVAGLRIALVTAFIMAIITSIPQIHLWYVRGLEWNGSCAYMDTDELEYAAYTNALKDGRPRRSNPYTGNDQSGAESYFSLQFFPAYVLGVAARLLNLRIDTAYMILLPLATIATVLAVWWLLLELTENPLLAVVGSVCVISLGTAAAHSPLQAFQSFGTGYDPFPFLRRYSPALPFPIFLLSTLFIWRALTRNLAWGVLSGVGFIILVYSYFFLWSALAAWFFTVLFLWLIARPTGRAKTLKLSLLLIVFGAIGLTPYLWFVMHRPESMDRGQILELTHAPDLFRGPEIYGALIICLLIYHFRRRVQEWADARILFAASFALAPFVVFNQQIITGRSLQPFHYEEFATNYWVVIAGFMALAVRRYIPNRVFVYLAAGGIGVAVLLGVLNSRIMESSNVRLDEVREVALKLDQESNRGVVFASDRYLTHSLSVNSDMPVLWARYLYLFSNIDFTEQKQRYYQYLYYSEVNQSQFADMLRDDFTTRLALFGAERANPVLTANHHPITEADVANAATEYDQFIKSFDSTLAVTPLLSYAVVSQHDKLSNIDKWYERDAGEKNGEFVIYHLKPKIPLSANF
jgi:hypothetical protein